MITSSQHVACRVSVIALGLSLFVLSGCLRINMETTVYTDDTVDGSLTVALNDEVIEIFGAEDSEAFVDTLIEDMPGQTREEPYEQDGFTGKTVHFEDVSLSEFNAEEDPEADAIYISHKNDRFILTGRWNLPEDTGNESFPGADQISQEVQDSMDLSVAVTFPGEVIEHNGQLDGRTVTWQLSPGQDHDLSAVAEDSPPHTLAYIVLAASVVILLLVLAALYFRLRKYSLGRLFRR